MRSILIGSASIIALVATPAFAQAQGESDEIVVCQRRYKMGPATGLKVGQSIQTKSLSLRLGLIGVGEAAVA